MRRINLVLALVLLIGLSVWASSLVLDRNYLEREALKTVTAQLTNAVKAKVGQAGGVHLATPDAEMGAALEKAGIPTNGPLRLTLTPASTPHGVGLQWELEQPDAEPVTGKAEKRLPNWLSVLPPIIAVTLALATQRLFWSLGAGILFGAMTLTSWKPVPALDLVARQYLWHAISEELHLQIFFFTSALLGMVSVINRMGGTRGIVESLQRVATDTRSTQFATWLMGLAVFFDDYANTVVVGSTMRSVTDKLRISREKLAYIVDTTAAPVSGLAIVSTWIGYEVGLFQEVLDGMGVQESGFNAFMQALPFRFYCIFALLLLVMVILFKRDLGPMLAAERRARQTGEVLRNNGQPLTSKTFTGIDAKEGIPYRWFNALIPVALVVLVVLGGLFTTGGGWSVVAKDSGAFFTLDLWRDAFSNGSSGTVLCWAAIAGSVMAIGLALGQGLLSFREALQAWGTGLVSMWMAMILLTLAWMINGVCTDLGTAYFLVAAFKDTVPPLLVPALIFLLGSAISFATGSSWSTMAILIPTAVPLAFQVGQQLDTGGLFLMFMAMGAVLDGSIFGDHCSPLSDTTLMTSITTCCDHLDHVKTQVPYALLGGVTALAFGYLPAAMGWSPWLSYPVAALVFGATLWLWGRDPEARLQPSETGTRAPLPIPTPETR